jgi:uncharacterized MAPEG superfamily protein
MVTAYACVVVAFLLNMLSKAPVAVAMSRQPGGYDNHTPRDQQAALGGWGRRALSAHLNSFEAFPGFAIAVLLAASAGADPVWTGRLAVTFVVARIAYVVLYIADRHVLRSTVWTLGFATTLAIYVLALRAL